MAKNVHKGFFIFLCVKQVVENLLISHIELRTEDSSDVVPYTFRKNMETIVVPIGGKLTEIRDRYIQV